MTDQYKLAIQAADELYTQDPQTEEHLGEEFPKEYLYALRMVEMLQWYYPQADEAHLFAARTQHICRWEIPRAQYPDGKAGYHKWRTFLYTYQADKATELLKVAGWDRESIDRVYAMVSKKGLKSNSDTQLIEDVICLVFIQHYVEVFAQRYTDDIPKLYSIIQKTWKKMSDKGHEAALRLDIPADLQALLKEAITAG